MNIHDMQIKCEGIFSHFNFFTFIVLNILQCACITWYWEEGSFFKCTLPFLHHLSFPSFPFLPLFFFISSIQSGSSQKAPVSYPLLSFLFYHRLPNQFVTNSYPLFWRNLSWTCLIFPSPSCYHSRSSHHHLSQLHTLCIHSDLFFPCILKKKETSLSCLKLLGNTFILEINTESSAGPQGPVRFGPCMPSSSLVSHFAVAQRTPEGWCSGCWSLLFYDHLLE